MSDNILLGDLYMKQRQGDLLDEREQTRLAHKATGHQKLRYRVEGALSRLRHRLETKTGRARQRPSPEGVPSTPRRDALG